MVQDTLLINRSSLFTSNTETSILSQSVPDVLLDSLIQRGYFGSNSAHWVNRIKHCGSESVSIHAYYDCSHDFAIEAGCNSRLCPRCMVRYQKKVMKKLGFIIGRMREIRFLTISPKNYTIEEFNSGFAMQDLNHIWQQVRKRLEFDFGYPLGSWIAVREFKFNDVLNNWNIHLHIVYDSVYIPQKLIKNIVYKYTRGRSRHADIRKIDPYGSFGHVKTARYISKYIGKLSVPDGAQVRISD